VEFQVIYRLFPNRVYTSRDTNGIIIIITTTIAKAALFEL
jgi:hypothetical protein